MDFRDSPADAEFRAAARAVLEEAVAALPGAEPPTVEERLPWFQGFQRTLRDAGYAGLAWPREYGGRDATLTEQAIFLQEYDRAGAPDRLNLLGEGLAGPTIIDFGTEEHRRRFLEPILSGEEIWCQLFSEPNAGSDLAALETRAERDGDGWRVTGQKVWTSRAQVASFGMLLARTGGPRHKGITYFLLPMDSEGVTVRPLRHMLGEAEFNEVFLDDVHIPDDLRIGEVDGGWRVAMATLSYERVALATGRVNVQRLVNELVSLVAASPYAQDTAVRRKLADLYARAQVQRVNGLRALSSLERGTPGPEASIGKLLSAPLVEDIADFALSLSGLDGQLDEGEPDPWLKLSYQARGTSIAGGTTFIQRNIVAERALGLPR
ncbi:MAG TPA: acyl-CoA dehydrogenase family protein [Baekduia sp.]|uniref:acyl-CoA dehydrogenase family protein n=1 Tax=Baekduia sp. TaxID=2600305 RepID=UPI002D7A246E|nr:acyl-CoA dehydrogenase family protein [Baekduia sp.]HET6507942.1 acyl-CoA dehydrogenase family protein [Baekduia sp.]